MTRRKGFGGGLPRQHPVDDLVGGTAPMRQATPTAAHDRPQRVGFYLDRGLIEGLRDAVDALSGPPTRATLNGVVRDALARELHRLEKTHNGGQPFAPRPGRLKPGRR